MATGGATHVLVVECRKRALIVWFEAAGEGIRTASFTGPRRSYQSAAGYGRQPTPIVALARKARSAIGGAPGGRFVRIGKTERAAPK